MILNVMPWELWLLFCLAVGVASLSPGPNVVIVMVNAMRFGVKGAAFTILGNLICLFSIAVLAAAGIGTVLATMPVAYTIMKIAGGLYLAWLGYKMLRQSFQKAQAGAQAQDAPSIQTARPLGLMAQAFLISAGNPKSILFLSAVFPQFLTLDQPIVPQFGVMFASLILIVCTIHGGYAALAVIVRKCSVSQRFKAWLQRVTGVGFIGMGAGLAIRG